MNRDHCRLVDLRALSLAAIPLWITTAVAAQNLTYADLSNAGVQTSGSSPAISSTGRYVAFMTPAAIDPADTNGLADVYLRDTQAATTSWVSLTSANGVGNGQSATDFMRGVSTDGRYVLFASDATNMVPNDTNGVVDYFVRDRVAGTTVRASVGNAGQQAATFPLVQNFTAAMTSDGRYVVFGSSATNLVPGDTNGSPDVFRFDRTTLTSTLVSVSTSGTTGNGWSGVPTVSADGRFVAFESTASNLLVGDANGAVPDAFVRDMLTGTTTIVGRGTPGNAQAMMTGTGSPSISADGRYVAFNSLEDLTPETHAWTAVYLRDRVANVTTLVSPPYADRNTFDPQISGDGTKIAYWTDATNLAPGHFLGASDVYRWDRLSGWTTRVSSATLGIGQGSDYIGTQWEQPGISFDGRTIAWADSGSNLIQPDALPGVIDTFVWHEPPPPPVRIRRFP